MPGKAWTDVELTLVQGWVEDGFNRQQIVELLEKRGYARTYKAVQRLVERKPWRALVKPSPFALDKPVTLETDKALLLFDIHAPFQHATWLNRVIDLALAWGVEDCAVGGDLVELSSISYWGRAVGVELQAELDAGCMVMRTLAANFKRKVLVGGNHEFRLVRKLENTLTLGQALDYFVASPSTETSNHKWFWLKSGGRAFRVGHPKNYSRIPTRTAWRLASKYRCSVIVGHNHLWGITRDVSNGWWAVDAGCCLDAKRVGWLEQEMSTNPEVVLGAVIVMDGVPVLLGRHNIEFYERMKR